MIADRAAGREPNAYATPWSCHGAPAAMTRHDIANGLWPRRRVRHVGLLCHGAEVFLVGAGFRALVLAGVRLRLPSGRLAVWLGGGGLGRGRRDASASATPGAGVTAAIG